MVPRNLATSAAASETAPPNLPVTSTWLPADGSSLLAALPVTAPLAWVRRGEGLVGWGVAARIVLRGPDRFTRAAEWTHRVLGGLQVMDEVRLPGSGPVAFGSFAFDESQPSVLILPRMIIGRYRGRSWLTVIEPSAPTPGAAPRPPGTLRYGDADPQAWQHAVAVAVDRIRAGQLSKVVLARELAARSEHPVDPRWLASRLAERFPDCWTFLVEGLIGATPELLVRLRDGAVTSRVLAGTMASTMASRVGEPPANPADWPAKDRAEHGYAVRSVLESLAGCAGETAAAEPFVLNLANVAHLATEVTGRAAPGSSVFALLAALHPSAAVCGTPRAAAARVIGELEGFARRRYAGPVGWVDATGQGEWGIALRCAELDATDPRRLTLYAGCGIVAGSDPRAEFAESEAKLQAIRAALATG